MDVFDYLSVENIVKKAKHRVKKFNEYSHKACYKLFKTSYNTDNLHFYRHQIGFCYELPLFFSLRQLKLSSL